MLRTVGWLLLALVAALAAFWWIVPWAPPLAAFGLALAAGLLEARSAGAGARPLPTRRCSVL
jgi:hypothetical protein